MRGINPHILHRKTFHIHTFHCVFRLKLNILQHNMAHPVLRKARQLNSGLQALSLYASDHDVGKIRGSIGLRLNRGGVIKHGDLERLIFRVIYFEVFKSHILYIAAHDLLTGKNDFESHYTLAEKQRFEAYVEKQLEKIEIPNKDISFLREKLLLMYANPLTNYLAARQ